MESGFSVVVLLAFIAVAAAATNHVGNNNPEGGGSHHHKKHHHDGQHEMRLDVPLSMCGIDCSSTNVATSADLTNNNGDRQQCRNCVRECKRNIIGGESHRNQTLACVDNIVASVVPAGSCANAYNCFRECAKTAKHDHHHGEGKKSSIRNCLTTSCPDFCSNVQSCGGSQTTTNEENQVCRLHQELRRAGRQCDACRAQCVQEGSCIAQYI